MHVNEAIRRVREQLERRRLKLIGLFALAALGYALLALSLLVFFSLAAALVAAAALCVLAAFVLPFRALLEPTSDQAAALTLDEMLGLKERSLSFVDILKRAEPGAWTVAAVIERQLSAILPSTEQASEKLRALPELRQPRWISRLLIGSAASWLAAVALFIVFIGALHPQKSSAAYVSPQARALIEAIENLDIPPSVEEKVEDLASAIESHGLVSEEALRAMLESEEALEQAQAQAGLLWAGGEQARTGQISKGAPPAPAAPTGTPEAAAANSSQSREASSQSSSQATSQALEEKEVWKKDKDGDKKLEKQVDVQHASSTGSSRGEQGSQGSASAGGGGQQSGQGGGGQSSASPGAGGGGESSQSSAGGGGQQQNSSAAQSGAGGQGQSGGAQGEGAGNSAGAPQPGEGDALQSGSGTERIESEQGEQDLSKLNEQLKDIKQQMSEASKQGQSGSSGSQPGSQQGEGGKEGGNQASSGGKSSPGSGGGSSGQSSSAAGGQGASAQSGSGKEGSAQSMPGSAGDKREGDVSSAGKRGEESGSGQGEDASSPPGGKESEEGKSDSLIKDSERPTERKAPLESDQGLQELPQGGNGDGANGLGGKQGFQEVRVPGADEKVDERFAGATTGIVENRGESRPRTELSDVKLARPDTAKEAGEQPVPLEYEDLIR